MTKRLELPNMHYESHIVNIHYIIMSWLKHQVHLVAVKCEVFTAISTREIQLCAWPSTQLMHSPLLLANCVCHSIAHARRFKWKGSIVMMEIHVTLPSQMTHTDTFCHFEIYIYISQQGAQLLSHNHNSISFWEYGKQNVYYAVLSNKQMHV